MLDDSIGKEKTIYKITELFYNLVDNNRESRGQQQFQEKKMQVYKSKDRLNMEIKELRLLMVKVSQRRHEERMKIYNSRAKNQNNSRRQKKIAEAKLVEHCNKKYGNQEN